MSKIQAAARIYKESGIFHLAKTAWNYVISRTPSPVPTNLSKNFIELEAARLDVIKKIVSDEINKAGGGNYSAADYERELNAHLTGRLENNRYHIVPWLNSARPLQGSNILEIGCGTGASTVAIAEQGARLTAIDIDEDTLNIAKERCKIYGLDVAFSTINATNVQTVFAKEHFDIVIFLHASNI